jgi:DNA-binding response OmpR family regulator
VAKILLVEDYESLKTIYSTTLTKEKHSVQTASNGEEGLALAKQTDFDVILLDLLMPRSDGFEFLRTFEPKKHAQTSIIILSNIFTTQLMNQALELGASQYLLKSDITPQSLAKVVRDTLTAKHNGPPTIE